MKKGKDGIYARYIKRILDVVLALTALVLFSWLYAILAALVRVKLGSPVLFTQERPGRDEKIFKLYKFRSMKDARDQNGDLLPDDERLTSFGRKLRSTSLDELPELFNILRGEMSLVGPRPLLVEYLPFYTEEERLRHTVRPGLTGLAQVSGRNFIAWDARLAKDVEYVNHLSFALDVRIFFLTIRQVLARSDVADNTGETEGNLAELRREAMLQRD